MKRFWVASSEGISLQSGRSATWSRSARTILDAAGGALSAWLPALPLLTLAAIMLVLPTLFLILGSFGLPRGATLDYWVDTFQSNGGRQAIWTSVRLGVVCAAVALLIGSPLAWFVSRMVTAKRSVWLALLNVAANFGGIGLAFGYMAALGTFGMVTLALREIRVPWVPPEIGSFTSLVMAYSYTNVPLFVLLTLPAMGILRQEWLEAAEVCAASRWQFWRYVGLPVLSPFLFAGFLLIFTWSIGIYGLAYALGSTAATTGKLRLITLQIGISLNSGVGSEERSYVLAAVLLLLASAALLTYRLVMKRALRWFS
jgi:putative spermidine/putrescine transport system permease protein